MKSNRASEVSRGRGSVLVTGAGGFIGSHLVTALRSNGIDVREVHRRPSPQAHHVLDVGPTTDWSVPLAGVDTVVHLAGRAHDTSEGMNGADVADYRRVNAVGTEVLGKAAADSGVRRLIFISSAGVMGPASVRPFTETDAPRPADAYAKSKLEAEELLASLTSSMEIVVLRPPLVYGPNAPGNFARLERLVERGFPLPLGSACGLRSFVYVDNLTSAIHTCLERPMESYQTFFVSDGEDVSVAEFVSKVGHAKGLHIRLVPIPLRLLKAASRAVGKRQDIERMTNEFQVDASRLRDTTGWAPPFTLDEGLRLSVRPGRGR